MLRLRTRNLSLLRWPLLSALFLTAPVLLTVPAMATEFFGAIAYSPSTRTSTTATAWVEDAAKGQALFQCMQQSQVKDCEIQLSFSNGYGVLAVSSNGILGIGASHVSDSEPITHGHEDVAVQKALSLCESSGGKNCKVVTSKSAVRYPLLELEP